MERNIAAREQKEIPRAVQLDLPVVVGKLVCSLRFIVSTNPEVIEKIRTEASYSTRNAASMRYPEFRRQHLFVGPGVIEAGCKTVIGSRL